MSYDVNIICINQKEKAHPPFALKMLLKNEVDEPDRPFRHYGVCPFMSSLKGVWYTIVLSEEHYSTAFGVVDSDFDNVIDESWVPYWVSGDRDYELIQECMTPLVVLPPYEEDFEAVLRFLVNQSPDKTIMFFTRYQGGEREIIHGVIELDLFIELLFSNKIYFNTCYIIRENCQVSWDE